MTKVNLARMRWLVTAALVMCIAAGVQGAVTVTSAVRGSTENSGITWVWLNLNNPTTEPINGILEFSGYDGSGGRSNATYAVDQVLPGTTRKLNIALPLLQSYSASFRDNQGNNEYISLPTGYGWNRYVGFLHVSDQQRFMSELELDDFTLRVKPEDRSGGSYSTSGTSGTTPTLSPSDRIITQTTPDQLPENWLCYVPLYNVFIDQQSYDKLTGAQQEALDTWQSMGGTLTLYGTEAETTESLGGGRLVRVKDNPLLDGLYIPMVGHATFSDGSKLKELSMPYKEERAGGRNGAFHLATLFLIVAGPVNFIYFSRRGQIRKIIVSLPIISIAFCSVIAVYFVFTQGFARKGGSISLTVLNEGTNRAVTFARHSLLSGLYPLHGFRFSSDTYLLPIGLGDRVKADIDLTTEIRLKDGLFQPGIPFDYATITPHVTKERMIFDGDGLTLQNGFELPAQAVAVFDDGTYYAGGSGAPGAKISLKAVDETAIQKPEGGEERPGERTARMLTDILGKTKLSTDELESVVKLATSYGANMDTSGTVYAVLLDGIPKGNSSGVEISDGKNLHILIGQTGETAP